MLPVLLDLRVLKIYTFGVFLVLAFFWASYLLWRNIRVTSFKEEDIFDSLFVAIISALLGGRFLYIAFHFQDFGFNIFRFILINGYPGLSLIGVLLGGMIGLFAYFKIHKEGFLERMDYFISPLFVALGFGFFGAFLSGVEVGAKTKFLLAIKYVGFDGFRHITGIYEALFFFLAAYVSLKLLFEIRREKLGKGFLFYFFVWYTSLVIVVFDSLKINHINVFGYSLNFIVGVFLLLTFSFYFIYYFRSRLGGGMKNVLKLVTNHGHKTQQHIAQRIGRKAKNSSPSDSKTD